MKELVDFAREIEERLAGLIHNFEPARRHSWAPDKFAERLLGLIEAAQRAADSWPEGVSASKIDTAVRWLRQALRLADGLAENWDTLTVEIQQARDELKGAANDLEKALEKAFKPRKERRIGF